MSDPRYTVKIERLVLCGTALTPGQAEALRAQVAGELQRLLAQGVRPSSVSRSSLASLDLTGSSAGAQLAVQLAGHIAQALPGGWEGER
jgi:hypothetical protein